MTDPTVRLSLQEAHSICEAAALRLGSTPDTAASLARSAVLAEAEGQPNVGLAHMIDYLEAMKAGRIDPVAVPQISRPVPAFFVSDAKGGAAHTGFDLAFDGLKDAARTLGIALFTQKNAYTCGALGYFTSRLAEAGLFAFATTNGPALMAGSGGTKRVFCTNPLAFSAPSADGRPLTIDQASTATAYVSIRKAAEEGRSIPEGWALDEHGEPTTDPNEALRGALLAFGGARGANIALMVEMMSAAISGANWSVDAPSFTDGNASPGTGMLVIAINASLIEPGSAERVSAHLSRLSEEYGVHVPGRSKIDARLRADARGLEISEALHRRLLDFAQRKPRRSGVLRA